MSDILDAKKLKHNILSDMRVELTEEFDKNFERKAFSQTNGNSELIPKQKALCYLLQGHCDAPSRVRLEVMVFVLLRQCLMQQYTTREELELNLLKHIFAEDGKVNTTKLKPIFADSRCLNVNLLETVNRLKR